ncbi:MAG: hypothetical protein ACTTHG_06760 [Treponemataceae bacterium]
MGKKNFEIVFCFFLMFVFAGCSKKTNYKITPEVFPTLRNKIVYIDKNTDWTENIDKNLEEKTFQGDKNGEIGLEGIDQTVAGQDKKYLSSEDDRLTIGVHNNLSELNIQERLFYQKNLPLEGEIYPEIEGFGSLDTGILESSVCDVIERFILGIDKKVPDETVIAQGSKFLLPVFTYDFQKIPKITKYLIGKPYIVQDEFMDEYQVPVRLYTKEGFIDSIFFMINQNNTYYVEQVYYGAKK